MIKIKKTLKKDEIKMKNENVHNDAINRKWFLGIFYIVKEIEH